MSEKWDSYGIRYVVDNKAFLAANKTAAKSISRIADTVNFLKEKMNSVDLTKSRSIKDLGKKFFLLQQNIQAVGAAFSGFMNAMIDSRKLDMQLGALAKNPKFKAIEKQFNNLENATQGMLNKYDLIGPTSKAMAFGIDLSNGKLTEMTILAQKASTAMGEDFSKSFDDMMMAMGRGSKMIADNLGVLMDVKKANEDYAKTLGKTARALTDSEKKIAFQIQFLKKLRENYNHLGKKELYDPLIAQQKRLQGAFKAAKNEMASWLVQGVNFVEGAAKGLAQQKIDSDKAMRRNAYLWKKTAEIKKKYAKDIKLTDSQAYQLAEQYLAEHESKMKKIKTEADNAKWKEKQKQLKLDKEAALFRKEFQSDDPTMIFDDPKDEIKRNKEKLDALRREQEERRKLELERQKEIDTSERILELNEASGVFTEKELTIQRLNHEKLMQDTEYEKSAIDIKIKKTEQYYETLKKGEEERKKLAIETADRNEKIQKNLNIFNLKSSSGLYSNEQLAVMELESERLRATTDLQKAEYDIRIEQLKQHHLDLKEAEEKSVKSFEESEAKKVKVKEWASSTIADIGTQLFQNMIDMDAEAMALTVAGALTRNGTEIFYDGLKTLLFGQAKNAMFPGLGADATAIGLSEMAIGGSMMAAGGGISSLIGSDSNSSGVTSSGGGSAGALERDKTSSDNQEINLKISTSLYGSKTETEIALDEFNLRDGGK